MENEDTTFKCLTTFKIASFITSIRYMFSALADTMARRAVATDFSLVNRAEHQKLYQVTCYGAAWLSCRSLTRRIRTQTQSNPFHIILIDQHLPVIYHIFDSLESDRTCTGWINFVIIDR